MSERPEDACLLEFAERDPFVGPDILRVVKERVELEAEVARLKAELEARKLSGGICDAAHQATRDGAAERMKKLRAENARLRECLVDAITLADSGIVASRGATMRWRGALGPLPGETTGGGE